MQNSTVPSTSITVPVPTTSPSGGADSHARTPSPVGASELAGGASRRDRGGRQWRVVLGRRVLRRMRKRVLILDHGRLVDDISPQDLAE